MRYHVAVLPEHRIGTVRFAGAIDGDVIRKALEALYTHPAWRPGFSDLWDGLGIQALAVRPAGADRLVAQFIEFAGRAGSGRTAIVTRRELDAAFVRMVCARMPRLPRVRKIFRLLPRAIGWVGQDIRHAPASQPATQLATQPALRPVSRPSQQPGLFGA